MILGIFERDAQRQIDPACFRNVLETFSLDSDLVHTWSSRNLGMIATPRGDDSASSGIATAGNLSAAFCGSLDFDGSPAQSLLDAYRACSEPFPTNLGGTYAAAIADLDRQRLVIARDPLGVENLYLYQDSRRVVFGSTIPLILRLLDRKPELELEAVARVLMFNYNPGRATVVTGITKLRPGFAAVCERNELNEIPTWHLSFEEPIVAPEHEIAEGVIDRVRSAVRRRIPSGASPAVFVSGGLDSSTVLGLVRELSPHPIRTYSYRCSAASFDESQYARRMADFVGATHTEVDYRPEDVLRVSELVDHMNEPFCDVGINIATYLIAQEAAHHHQVVLTGDGGDELFGGHPIYEADKIARFIDPVPSLLRTPLLSALTLLPDSDQKKSPTVKLKRFGESAMFPAELLSHRWRIYYSLKDLEKVLTPEFYASLDPGALFGDILAVNREAAGLDPLSQSLYSDYATITDFYLRRNDLFAHLGLYAKYPLFDRELVEYCARIPSRLKIRGWFDTKYVFKKAIEDLLPRDIVYRRDKLGHSIPMKNWIREHPKVKEFVLDLVAGSSIRRRGLVRPEFVDDLVTQHMRKRRNNSHRLWTLVVLELWCRQHLDA